jgi:hypothetical protein
VNAPADPPGTTQARDTLPTTEGPETTQDTAHQDEGHQGRGPSWPSPSAGSLNRSREESQRHPPHLATTTSNKPQRACSPSSPARAQTTQNKHVLAHSQRRCTEMPTTQSRCEDGKWSQRINTAPRASNSPNTSYGSPTPSKPGPSALQEGGPSYRKGGTLLNATPPLMRRHVRSAGALPANTRRTTHHASVRRMRQDVPHVLHQTLHTLPRPLKMKQNSGDARLAATPTTQPPPRRLWCAPSDAWETEENLSVDPGMAAAIKEWNTVYKDQATPECRRTRQGPHQQ